MLNESHKSSCHERVLSYLHVTIATLYFYETVCYCSPLWRFKLKLSHWNFLYCKRVFSPDFVWQANTKKNTNGAFIVLLLRLFNFHLPRPMCTILREESNVFCQPNSTHFRFKQWQHNGSCHDNNAKTWCVITVIQVGSFEKTRIVQKILFPSRQNLTVFLSCQRRNVGERLSSIKWMCFEFG